MTLTRAIIVSSAIIGIVTACSSSRDELVSEASETLTIESTENYQSIYRRLKTNAERCSAGDLGPYASMLVEGDLYPDLGFGEISLSLSNLGTRNFYWYAKIAKSDGETSIEAWAGNTIDNSVFTDQLTRWVNGGTEC